MNNETPAEALSGVDEYNYEFTLKVNITSSDSDFIPHEHDFFSEEKFKQRFPTLEEALAYCHDYVFRQKKGGVEQIK